MTDADRVDREAQLTAGLRRLAADTVVPPIDPAQEERLLAAFDAHWSPRLAGSRARSGQAAAFGLLAAAATLVWAVAIRDRRADLPVAPPIATSQTAVRPVRPQSDQSDRGQTSQTAVAIASPSTPTRVRRPRPVRQPAADPTFVIWPGASDLPRFESGQLMRVELPAPVAASLGLRPPQPSAFVQTDVLVGQDGYARAVRLVQ